LTPSKRLLVEQLARLKLRSTKIDDVQVGNSMAKLCQALGLTPGRGRSKPKPAPRTLSQYLAERSAKATPP